MSKRQSTKEVFLVISSFLVGSLVMFTFMILLTKLSNPSQETEKRVQPITQIFEKSSLSTAVEKIMDATVVVQGFAEGEQRSTGSGFFYKVENNYAYILTNEHILQDKDEVKIILTTDEVVKAELLGKDAYLDLAVLRVPEKYASLIATLGSSEQTNIGETIFTVGTPMGYEYRGSVTAGILSGKDRMVALAGEETGSWQMKVLQIDAPINPGSSGGPLLNSNGEVIGICTMKLIDNQIEGMGFAIPIEYAINHTKSLENKETIKWPYLGIETVNASNATALAEQELLSSSRKTGAVVTKVKENGPASKTDLKRGDIIIEIDGLSIKNVADLKYKIYQYQSGDKVTITYLRDGKEHKESITLH